MSNTIRERALRVLNNHESAAHTAIHNAVIDLRRNAESGDERILRPFLSHPDPMVVGATLYTLFEVHNQRDVLRPMVERFAGGDPRDDTEMPIQTMAISLLSMFGNRDAPAIARLLEIAENRETADAPRKRAWQKLAELFNIDWSRSDTDEILRCPESDASEQIRSRIRKAIREA